MKLGIYNHVVGVPTHANPCGAATTWVVWANTRKKGSGFLGILFLTFYFFCFIFSAHASGPILTIYTSYDVFLPKDVPFGGIVHTAPHFEGKMPQKPLFWGVNRHFQVLRVKY